jgi:hypothetical protein
MIRALSRGLRQLGHDGLTREGASLGEWAKDQPALIE